MVICIVAGDTVVAAFQFDRQPPDLGWSSSWRPDSLGWLLAHSFLRPKSVSSALPKIL